MHIYKNRDFCIIISDYRIGEYKQNDLLNEKVKVLYNNVEDFYNKKDVKIETSISRMNDFTLFVRNRFKKEWEKPKTGKVKTE